MNIGLVRLFEIMKYNININKIIIIVNLLHRI